ncbi:MAG: hypothetical protein IJ338_05765 [Bacteroidaceae bacterium]|nr:hypothetical protein [Bacteroidaceae bacterium]
MKHILLLLFILSFFTAYSQTEKSDTTICSIKTDSTKNAKTKPIEFKHHIDMLDFEKERSSTKESFSLRNNTPHTVTRVFIKLVYKTPDDVMIDNREIMVDGDILPYSTKKFDIKSFDNSRKYRFYKSKIIGKDTGKAFKVYFDLLRYDIAVTE